MVTSDDVMAALRELLRSARKDAGLGQIDVGFRMGAQSQSAVSDLESGRNVSPTLDTLVRWVEGYGAEVFLEITPNSVVLRVEVTP